MKPSKSKYTPKYKCDSKLKIYDPNSTSLKGLYNTNLKKAKKLYVNNKWKAPGKYKIQKPQSNLNNMLNTYMKDVETMKKKDTFKNQNEEDFIINQEDLMYKKQEVQKLFESFEPFFEDDDFTDPSIILNSIPDDQNDENQKLKNSKTQNDYMMRLNPEYENESENENVNEEKNQSINKSDNKSNQKEENSDMNEENNNIKGSKNNNENEYEEKEEIDKKPGYENNLEEVNEEIDDYQKEFNDNENHKDSFKESINKSNADNNIIKQSLTDNNNNNDNDIYTEIENKVLSKTSIQNIDLSNNLKNNNDNENDYYSKFKEHEEDITKIQKRYKRFKTKKNEPELKNKIYNGWDEYDKNLMFLYADDVKDNQVQSLDVKIYSREKMNITIQKYSVDEMFNKHIIEKQELTLDEAKDNVKNISDNIFDVMNGKDPLDRKKQLAEVTESDINQSNHEEKEEKDVKEEKDEKNEKDVKDVSVNDDKSDFPIPINASLNKNNNNDDAFPQGIPNSIPYDGGIQQSIVANNNVENSFPMNQNSFPRNNNYNEDDFPIYNNNDALPPSNNNLQSSIPYNNQNNNNFEQSSKLNYVKPSSNNQSNHSISKQIEKSENYEQFDVEKLEDEI